MSYLHVVRTRPPTWQDVAPRVKALVEKNFASQKAFAKALGEEESTVSQWLSGKRNPRVDVAIRAVRLAGGVWSALFDEGPDIPDPRLSPARDRVGRLRQEVEACARNPLNQQLPSERTYARLALFSALGDHPAP